MGFELVGKYTTAVIHLPDETYLDETTRVQCGESEARKGDTQHHFEREWTKWVVT